MASLVNQALVQAAGLLLLLKRLAFATRRQMALAGGNEASYANNISSEDKEKECWTVRAWSRGASGQQAGRDLLTSSGHP